MDSRTGDRQRPHRGAVVGEVAADGLDAVGLADLLEVLAGQLPGRLDRLGSSGGEEHPVQVTGRQRRQLGRQLDGGGVGVGPDREVPECRRLVAGGTGQFGAAVAQLADEQSGQAIQVTVALIVPDVAAIAALDDVHAVDVVLQHAEVTPEMASPQLREPIVFHASPPSVEPLPTDSTPRFPTMQLIQSHGRTQRWISPASCHLLN